MPALSQEKATYKGIEGTVTTIIDLIPHEEFAKISVGLAMSDKAMSVGKLMKVQVDSPGLSIHNHITGTKETIPWTTIVELFKGFDLDNSIARISFRFQPDPNHQYHYPSEMADEMRKDGIPEEQIQELIGAEKLTRQQQQK